MLMKIDILQGDCCQTLKSLPDASVQMVILDPPHNEWPTAANVFEQVPRICRKGFVVCFCRVSDISELLQIAKWEGLQFFDSYVWHDPQPSFVHSSRALRTHEHILVFRCGFPNLPSLKLGKKNDCTKAVNKGQASLGKWRGGQRKYVPSEFRQLTSVLSFPRPLNGPLGRWQKPEKLIYLLVKAYCPEGGTILDPFGGSGTTAQVAMENNRNAIICELNPDYVDLINKRLSVVTPSLFGREAE